MLLGGKTWLRIIFLLYIQGFKGFYCHMLKKGGRSCDVLALALHTCNFAGWNKTVAPSPSRGHKTKLRGQETWHDTNMIATLNYSDLLLDIPLIILVNYCFFFQSNMMVDTTGIRNVEKKCTNVNNSKCLVILVMIHVSCSLPSSSSPSSSSLAAGRPWACCTWAGWLWKTLMSRKSPSHLKVWTDQHRDFFLWI